MLMPVWIAAACSCSITMQQKVCNTGNPMKCLHYECDHMLALSDVHKIELDRYACHAVTRIACSR